MKYFSKRTCKRVNFNYFAKPIPVKNIRRDQKVHRPFNLALLKEAIVTFINKNCLVLKPKTSLIFLLDSNLKNFLVENFKITKR